MTPFYLALIAYIPGAFIFRAPIAHRARRAGLPAEERLFWAVVMSVVTSSVMAFALAAMSIYSLERLLVCNAVLAVVVAVVSRGDLRLGTPARRPNWTAALPAMLIVLGVWMYFTVPASEYILGGRDPGIYVNEGIQIAQRQSLVTTDTVAAAVPGSTRDLFFPPHGGAGYYSLRFMGFHLRDPETGAVSGQFPQGYPLWIAIAYGLDGVTGTRRVVAWWAILGVLSVYFAGRRLIGPLPAAAAAGLLTVNVIQTWYARFPNSEIVTQALLFAALLAHAYAHEDDDKFFGPVAASLLGVAMFTRIPVVLAVGAAGAASLLARVSGHRARAGFLITLCLWGATASLYYVTHLRPYFSRPITDLQMLGSLQLAGLGAAAAAGVALLWVIRTQKAAAALRRWLPIALIGVVITGGVYALVFREPSGPLAPHDAHSVRMFAHLYFGPFAFGLALAGYALVVWRSFWRAPALILSVTALAFFFLYKMRIWPEHFWLARRFVPAILPGALIFFAAAVFAPLWLLPRERLWAGRRLMGAVSMAVGVLGVVLLGQRYVAASSQIRSHVEYAGVIPKIERLAARFGDDDLVLFEAREASDVHVLALPLAYIYARNVLVFHTSRPDKPSVVRFLTWARQRYKNVYFVAGGGTDLLSPGIGSHIVSSESFRVAEYEKTAYDVYPRSAILKPFDFTIYKLVESSSAVAPHFLDIGAADDLYVVDFHPKERLGGGDLTFRWTQDTSYLLMGVQSGSRSVILRLSSGRPTGIAQPRVAVYLDGRLLGTAEPTTGLRDYTFPISGPLASELAQRGGPSQIRVESATWTPRDVLGGTDNRALGVMIDRAEIR